LNTKFQISPPIDSLDIRFQEFIISSSRDTIIVTDSGTKIYIPKNSFNYSDGTAVEGEVKIRFREFNDPVDFFLSGIPMEYDSANTKYTFESAGMIEIRANKLGRELQLSNNEQISIDMVSESQENNYNVYNLNDSIGSWTYNGKDEVYKSADQQLDLSADYSNNDSTVIKSYEYNDDYIEAVEPKLINENKYAFNYNLDRVKFPEFAQYPNILFEIDESKCNFKETMFSVVWENKDLKRSDVKGEYLLTLSKGDTGVKLVVYPVFELNDYNVAIEKYNKQKALMEEARNERKQANSNNSIMNSASAQQVLAQGFNRRYSINRMGIHNIDRPIFLPMIASTEEVEKDVINAQGIKSNKMDFSGKEISLIIMDKEGIPLNYNEINAIDLNRNALYRFSSNSNLKVNENAKILIWVVTTKGEIAIVEPDFFTEKIKMGNSVVLQSDLYSCDTGVNALKNFLN